jgi:hypothetical protein
MLNKFGITHNDIVSLFANILCNLKTMYKLKNKIYKNIEYNKIFTYKEYNIIELKYEVFIKFYEIYDKYIFKDKDENQQKYFIGVLKYFLFKLDKYIRMMKSIIKSLRNNIITEEIKLFIFKNLVSYNNEFNSFYETNKHIII